MLDLTIGGYEIYQEYLEEQRDCDEDFSLKEHKIKGKVSILTLDDFIGNFHKTYKLYSFNGSNLFIVDEDNKMASHFVEPREYDKLSEAIEYWRSDVGTVNEMSLKLVTDDIKKFSPKLIIVCE